MEKFDLECLVDSRFYGLNSLNVPSLKDFVHSPFYLQPKCYGRQKPQMSNKYNLTASLVQKIANRLREMEKPSSITQATSLL